VLPWLPRVRRFTIIRNRSCACVDESKLDPPRAIHSARIDLDSVRRQPVDRPANARSETHVRGVLAIVFLKHQWQFEMSPVEFLRLSEQRGVSPPGRDVNSPRNGLRISALSSSSWTGAQFQYERRPFRRELSGR
jgi:hypothetical protein